MGESSQTQQTQQTTRPWEPAVPTLTGILGNLQGINPNLTGNQSGAIDQMTALARAGNPYAPAIGNFATTMLAGGGPDRSGLLSDAYRQYQSDLSGTARGDYLDPQRNPFFGQTTQNIGNDIQNRVNSMFAGAGRDLSGMNQQTLSRGLAEGLAPAYSNVYNTERSNQLAAQGAMFGAGGQTAAGLSSLDQTRLGNMGMGVNAATAATEAQYDPYNRMLAAEAMRQGIPLSTMQQIAGIARPIAQLGTNSTGTQTTTMQQDPTQAIVGAGIAGLGMYMNPMGSVGGMFGGGMGRTNPPLNINPYGNLGGFY